MPRPRRLSAQILAGQLVVLVVTTLAGFVLSAYTVDRELDRQYEQRALAVAKSVAVLPSVRDAVRTGDPHSRVRALAARVRATTHVAYVVVANDRSIRLSHPNQALIGKRVSTPAEPLRSGRDWVGVQTGTLGRSARGKAPIFDGPDVIGEVSVGILEGQVAERLYAELPTVATYMLAALTLGTIVSVALARRLKRRTFGLELHEIAALLQEREAMLHGIREGVVTVDDAGLVTLVNDEARRLLGVSGTAIGRPLTELVAAGRLRDLLSGAADGDRADRTVLTERYCLTVSRMPVGINGRSLGAVITLRDKTEIETLLRELDGVRRLTDALRAQQHEFSNRIHTLSGLIELGRYGEAAGYLTEISGAAVGLADDLRDRIDCPILVAMLLAKTTIAAERGVTLAVTGDSGLGAPPADPNALATIVGNLIDNAVDAALDGDPPPTVTVRISDGADAAGGVTLTVSDSGPGVPADAANTIFEDGFTTKAPRDGMHRGLGLALVARLVHRLGGSIDVAGAAGAVFTVRIPGARVPLGVAR